MALAPFHPAIQRWFSATFTGPTEPQAKAWPAIRRGKHVLIAAPTGSGKTFAAFLSAIDSLLRQAVEGRLPNETQVVYVSPLKALSNDIQKNLAEPLAEIARTAKELGLPEIDIRTLVRTGDTPQTERQAMLKHPPHILVTTPESLYLMLTAARSRAMLESVRTVIVDEIHAVARDKRGSHLSLTLERLAALSQHRLQRIGLSATQKPIDEIARFLLGTGGNAACEIVDSGHYRQLDLEIAIPGSPLEAVMAAEVWEEIHERLEQLIRQHRTTLVFVNTRRLAERLTASLAERLGPDQVASHHGSLSRELRLDAEERLKQGRLKALVATASLELGIDVGAVDLVCQIGSTRSIATLLQRVGRSGHMLGAVPRGRIFPLSRDELIECAALVRAAREGRLDRLIIPEKPLDILAQQIVAAAASQDWPEDELFHLCRRAYPYRDLARQEFDEVVRMLAEGFTTRRGRRSAFLHYDGVHAKVRGRRGARLAALTSGGAIPDLADYRVVLEPSETVIGSVNEDFAVESMPGDIFQLGNASWRITRIGRGEVRVADAQGQPPTIPFWLGEAPGRTAELSEEVSRLREDIAARLDDPPAAAAWLEEAVGLAPAAARQIVEYLDATRKVLGVIPSQSTLVLERFFDQAGGMQLVLHAPFGSRINRAWGLALRKRFCRGFNFELQAAATEDAIVLSLGPQHSFELAQVFHYLHPKTARDLLIQALLDAPVFQTRWRWNTTRALAVLRARGGRKTPAPLQRMEADDLLAAVFPDAAACLENIAGDREIPDHPLVRQTLDDCLIEAMDLPGLTRALQAMLAGKLTLVARETPEPSPLSHEVLNARPYAFLDDAPLEERRTQAVAMRRSLDVGPDDLAALDPAAIARVEHEVWPEAETADELHDALLVTGALPVGVGSGKREARGEKREAGSAGPTLAPWLSLFEELRADGRATLCRPAEAESALWVATERVPMVEAAYPGAGFEPAVEVPARERAKVWTREDALRELVRGQLEVLGPVTTRDLASWLARPAGEVEVALAALETEGFVLRGHFTPGVEEREWCERRLLARIHRHTLDRLRQEIEPVSPADFMRFLFRWQRLVPETHAVGPAGLAAVLEQLDGWELPAAGWESDVLPARLEEYDPLWLDAYCLSGEFAWSRLSGPPPAAGNGHRAGPIRTTPIALFRREHAPLWRGLQAHTGERDGLLSAVAQGVMAALRTRGASFFGELVSATGLLRTEVENGLGELVAWGLVGSDSFAGLRALLIPSASRVPVGGAQGGSAARRRRGPVAPFGVETAGRWALLERGAAGASADAIEALARQLLRRYGVVFRALLEREAIRAPWRELLRIYWRLEARGELRGGRFVSGFSGEQFALPEAVGSLRAVRKRDRDGELIAVGAADPLNLVGVVTPGATVPALAGNRILYRDGVPVAVSIGQGQRATIALLGPCSPEEERAFRAAIVRRRVAPLVRRYLGRSRAAAPRSGATRERAER
jgi:ATP-dependent Lhr-like helicase